MFGATIMSALPHRIDFTKPRPQDSQNSSVDSDSDNAEDGSHLSECMVPFNPGGAAGKNIGDTFGRVDDGKFTSNCELFQLVGKKIVNEKRCVFRLGDGVPDLASSERPFVAGEVVGWVWLVENNCYFWAMHKENGNVHAVLTTSKGGEEAGELYEVEQIVPVGETTNTTTTTMTTTTRVPKDHNASLGDMVMKIASEIRKSKEGKTTTSDS
ncbi:hypothetical protein TrLO_g11993 [Triparma laevis f. longispina]|uniref:Uncharacterized protein n=1 Tax=Triparma laevis f. longispina TaxID=1714387 RepID=A0A9W7CHP7_9STRA|nr:hypothetical protein TrLO_g11993 [Triparma laevis f. longispina]